jgi:hypothetical protein
MPTASGQPHRLWSAVRRCSQARSTGAVIAGVQIKIANKETNFQYSAVTNTDGIYRVQSLQAGTYQVAFEASGFKRLVQDNVTLRTGDVAPVDATMQIGALTESVQVTAQNTLLETETSVSGTVTEGNVLYQMPIFQKQITASFELVPGRPSD